VDHIAERTLGMSVKKHLAVQSWKRAIAVAAVVLAMAFPALSQSGQRANRIREEIDSRRLVTLHGNIRADLTADRDLGPVEDGLQLRLYLVLQRSPEQQTELDNLLARQQQPTAPEYHKWLTPQEYGEHFGVSQQDIAKISAWLEAQGMHVNGVMNNAMFIDFSATALQVREVLHTQLHYYNIQGGKHAANAQDPMIPAALGNVVAGIKGLNKIPLQHHHTKVRPTSYDPATHRWHKLDTGGNVEASPAYSAGSGEYAVTPQDYYTIYNVNQEFNVAGNLGANASVAVIEQSDIEFGTVDPTTGAATGGDVATFRSLFGVPGTLNMHVYHGYGSGSTAVTCNAPGYVAGDGGEAALDAEWANALAPAANLIFMSCDQKPNQGIFTSMMALIDNNLSDIMSLSYGSSEQLFSAADYTSQDALFAQAAAQGQSIIVSAGDSGSDVNDQNTAGTATSGYNVSGLGAPNVTVAGGTDFSDLYDSHEGGLAQSTYWGATNSAKYGDALGYIPETAWNDSCASSILAKLKGGFTGAGYCATDPAGFVAGDVVGGSGGFSTHYAVPSYQSGIAGYSGTKRAQPDISGFAADGIWGHYLIFCDSFATPTACTSPSSFGGAGGTSFVAPTLAGVGGLLVSYTGSRQGLLNPALYALAKAQFTAAATKTACYSNGQTSNTGVTAGLPAVGCIFNDVTTSNNDMPCAAGSTNCYVNSGASFGMLSLTNASSLTVAYPSTPGYDEATGIGTVNVYNLITNWNTAFTSTTGLQAAPTAILSTQSTSLSATVTPGTPLGFTGPRPALSGSVSFAAGSTGLGNCTLSGGSCSLPVSGSALHSGANSITATFSGSKSYPASTSGIVTVTVTAVLAAQTISFPNPGPVTYGVAPITLGATASSGLAVSYAVTSGPATVSGSTLTITGAGSVTVRATQAGNSSYLAATPVSVVIAVNKARLTVTANNAARATGTSNPAFTYTITGFVNGNTSSVVTGTASLTTTATASSPVGTYAITFSTESLTASNYSFTYVNGSLVVFNTSSPLVLWLSPGSGTAGGGGFTLTVNGANFKSTSRVLWNGAVRATSFVSSTQLKATILAADLAAEGTKLVTVTNPAPGAATSAGQPFAVLAGGPVARISGGSISDAADGVGNHVLSLTGTDFVAGSVVKWNGVSLTTSYVSPWQATAVVVTASDSLPAVVTVVNPAGTSAGFTLR
jgi:Pro-kumamolisin, activation domain/MBG domain (YGX type)/Bacterial Ig-like domain (group 3)